MNIRSIAIKKYGLLIKKVRYVRYPAKIKYLFLPQLASKYLL